MKGDVTPFTVSRRKIYREAPHGNLSAYEDYIASAFFPDAEVKNISKDIIVIKGKDRLSEIMEYLGDKDEKAES